MLRHFHRAAGIALLIAYQCTGQPEVNFASAQEQAPLVAAQNATIASCQQACKQLEAVAGHEAAVLIYGDSLLDFMKVYYSWDQRDFLPLCVVQPRHAEAVSLVVKLVLEHQCPFAIKSGGHSPAAGVPSRQNGLVLDLAHLNQVEVSGDRKTISLGPGNNWRNVYKALEPHGLLVPGGRVSEVGVGGFVMGGGLSFFSARYGWAVDNVRNFEVVLPNGTLTNANVDSHPDLYFALRGGGSSFGVVTRFDFDALPHDVVWGGLDVYMINNLSQKRAALGLKQDYFDGTLHSVAVMAMSWIQKAASALGYGVQPRDVLEAFAGLADDGHDTAAHAFTFLVWVGYMKTYAIGTTYVYSEPIKNPEALRNLSSVPSITSSGRLAQVRDFTDDASKLDPKGRQFWRTATFKVDTDLMTKLWEITLVHFDSIKLAVPDASMGNNLQLITKNHIRLSARRGGNAFGIDPNDGPLFFYSITVCYGSTEHENLVRTAVEKAMSEAVAVAKEMGLYHPFIYPNYASAGQDVFSGYSPKTLQRLTEIQEVYDPGRVFARLQPKHLTLQ